MSPAIGGPRIRSGAILAALLTILSAVSLTAKQSEKAKEKEAKAEQFGRTVSVATPVKIEVRRGQTADIVLKGSAGTIDPLKFIIRSQPTCGTLSEPMASESNTAIIHYQHRGNATDTEDHFKYAVQSPGSPVSASAEVTIKIIHPEPKLDFPEAIDFGSTVIGEPISKELILRNKGGGEVSGTLSVDPPFQIEGDTKFRLGEGAESKIAIRFDPTWEGASKQSIFFSGRPTREIHLTGTGEAPIKVSPEQLSFQRRGYDLRSATAYLKVFNLSSSRRAIDIKVPAGIMAPAELVLSPNEERSIKVTADPGFPERVRGTIEVAAGEYRIKVQVDALPLPGRLTLEPPGPIRLDPMAPNATKRVDVGLKNVGGEALKVNVRTSVDVRLMTPRDPDLVISPGTTQRVQFEIQAPATGNFEREVSFLAGDVESRLHILGMIPGETLPSGTRTPVPQATPAPPVPEETPLALEVAKTRLRITSVVPGPSALTIGWIDPVKERKDYTYYLEKISFDSGVDTAPGPMMGGRSGALAFPKEKAQMITEWIPIAKARTAAGEGGRHSVLLEELPPASALAIKIVPIGLDGKPSRVGEIVRIRLPQPNKTGIDRNSVIIALIILCAAFLARRAWVARKKA